MIVGQDITCPTQIASGGTIRIRSPRAAQVAAWFGLDKWSGLGDRGSGFGRRESDRSRRLHPKPDAQNPTVALLPGTITLVAGPSGAGKSTLLRAARDAHPHRRWIDLASLGAPDVPLVDCFEGLDLRGALALLARVGLGEAWTYLRTPGELSEGQRGRFRLALGLHEADANRRARPAKAQAEGGEPILACDEFAAVLDRVTARIVAHRLRRAVDAMPHLAAVVATSHEDIEPPLRADVVVRCDFGTFETAEERR